MSIFCSAVRYLHHSTKNSQLINFVKQSTCCYLLTDVFNFILFSISFYYSRAFASKKKQKQIHRINTFCRVCARTNFAQSSLIWTRHEQVSDVCFFFLSVCVMFFVRFCFWHFVWEKECAIMRCEWMYVLHPTAVKH